MLEQGFNFTSWSESLKEYGDRGWSSEDLATIIASANLNYEPDETDMTWLQERTTLLPPRLLTELDEKTLRLEAPKTENPALKKVDINILKTILSGSFSDEQFLAVFPARTKIDLGIRRARAKTVYLLYQKEGKTKLWERWIPQLVNFDYITVCILMLCEIIHGDWLRFWASLKCLQSLDDLQVTTKWVSDRLKKHPAPMSLRLRYCEGGGVSGYRNPPFGNFDYFGETKKLAEGGEPHGIIHTHWLQVFETAAAEVQVNSTPKVVEYMTLEQFIASDLANTGGASTFGKVEWEFEGEKGKFKARKNFLLDISTPAYLAEQTLANLGKQVNKSFIKPELGKMRIAVTGDIWSYFSQSWLNYLTGEVYLQWPGNTLDERVDQQTQRMQDMRDASVGAYPLPFDFAAFDHQPEIDEVQILSRKFLERGATNVPITEINVWKDVLDKTVDSFAHAILIAQEGDKKEEYTILGGVESGIRLTSLLGNYWNGTMTHVGKDWLYKCGYKGEIKSWLRGDDSDIIGKNYWVALAMRLAYAAINAVGNDSKYGIHYQQSEFLRVWYGVDKNYGYPNRAIPGIMQRKPWSSEPWDPEGVLKAQLSTVDTLERRLARKLPNLRSIVCQDWSRIRHKSIDWLRLPMQLGGLGLLPWRGKATTVAWPKLEHPNIEITNLDPGSYNHYQTMKYWTLTENELKTRQSMSLVSKCASDDIRGLGQKFRDNYKHALSKMPEVQWTEVNISKFPVHTLTQTAENLLRISTPKELATTISTRGSGFGEYREMQEWWTEAQLIAQLRPDVQPMKMLQTYNVAMYTAVKHLERKGLHRGSALDYVFGDIAGMVVSPLSPLIASAVQSALSLQIAPWVETQKHWTRETWAWFTSVVAHWYADNLNRSPLSQTLFQW